MLLSPGVTAQPRQLTARQASRRPFVAVAAAAKKGFGSVKQQPKKSGVDGCPCGSGKTYKVRRAMLYVAVIAKAWLACPFRVCVWGGGPRQPHLLGCSVP